MLSAIYLNNLFTLHYHHNIINLFYLFIIRMCSLIHYSFFNSLKPFNFKEIHKNPSKKTTKIPYKTIKISSLEYLKDNCRQGNLKEAFKSLSNSFNTKICLDKAYALILELCSTQKCLSQGQQIHTHIEKSNLVEDSVFLGTKLVFMYGKCGCVLNGEKVFDKMDERTIFTWNAMIGAYVGNGLAFNALELYCKMRVFGVFLDSCTFPSVLKACGEIGNVESGREVHGLAIKLGFGTNVFVANSLVGMYFKCGYFDDAMLVFERIEGRDDVVSWNLMISGYCANGKNLEALKLFVEMLNVGLDPSTYTFVSAIQACDEVSLGTLGMAIHASVWKHCLHFDVYVANALLVMYTRCGKIDEALKVFDEIEERDCISWNSMLSGIVQNGLYVKALDFVHRMLKEGQRIDQASVVSIVSVCAKLENMLLGMEVHAFAIKNGLDCDLQIGNTLIGLYGKCSNIHYMDRVFDRLPYKDHVSLTTVIASYVQNSSFLKALELFRKAQLEFIEADPMMIGSILQACSGLKNVSLVKEIHSYILKRGLFDTVLENTIVDVYGECENIDYSSRVFQSIKDKNIVSLTSMIGAFVHNGFANEAIENYQYFKKTAIEPDSVALMVLLSAIASLSALRKGKEIHGFLIRKGFSIGGSIASSLLDMYAHCGTIENSLKVFYTTEDKDLVLYTTMINANGMHGYGCASIDLFKKMESGNIVPDHITFLAVLYACSHSGLVDEGKRYFSLMTSEYKLEPWPEHYTCLVDLLGRANQLEEAFEIVTKMPIEPPIALWSALLSACRVHSNEKLGKIAARKLLETDSQNAGNYVLVSNAFAAMGKWEDVLEVRTLMKNKSLKKEPACSWIEVGNKVHTFVARDKSHPCADKIYRRLEQINERLKDEGGYVADTRYVFHNVEEEEKIKMIYGHSERLAIAYGLLSLRNDAPIRITKNLRVCEDCHNYSKLVSKLFERKIIVRDSNRFHHFEGGVCSCGDFW